MSGLRKRAATLVLAAALFANGSTLAASRGDVPRDHFGSWLKLIVRVLDDIRANFPPG